MDLRRLSYFVAVAEAGSFSAAARRVHVSQPALTARLKDLEEELAVKLFFRHPRGVELTEAGRRLLPHAREVQEAVHRARHALEGTSRSSVLLGITPTLGLFFLPELLETCAAASGIDLVVSQASAATLLTMLESGKLDAVVSYGSPAGDRGQVLWLFEEDLFLVGCPDAVDASAGDIDFDSLQNVRLVVEPGGHLVRRKIDEIAAQRGVHLTIVAEVEPIAAKLALLRRSDVCTIVPKWIFVHELRDGSLHARSIRHPPLTLKLNLAFRRELRHDIITRLHQAVWATVDELHSSQPGWRIASRY